MANENKIIIVDLAYSVEAVINPYAIIPIIAIYHNYLVK